jgi:hypothetical protein
MLGIARCSASQPLHDAPADAVLSVEIPQRQQADCENTATIIKPVLNSVRFSAYLQRLA